MRLQKIEKAIKNMSDDKFSELLNDLGVNEKQWVPRYLEDYYIVSNGGDIGKTFWADDQNDNYLLLMNNVFKTEEEAKAQLDFNIEKAKLIKEIEESSDVIDWEDDGQTKYSMFYNRNDEIIDTYTNRVFETQGTTYTTNREFLENLIANEPERVKKYLFGPGDKVKFGTINKIHDSGEFYLVDDIWYHVDDIKPHKFVGQRYKVIKDRFEKVESGDIVELVEIFDNKCSMYERVRDRRRVALLDIDYPTPEVELTTTMDILEVGMLVELREGSLYVVLPDTSIYEGEFMLVGNNGFMSLVYYDGAGNHEPDSDYDIVKIYDNTKYLGTGLFSTKSREVLYERSN